MDASRIRKKKKIGVFTNFRIRVDGALNIIDIYGLSQLITEPTRVTQYSSTLIDLCLTNSPDKISKSGVINPSTSKPAETGQTILLVNGEPLGVNGLVTH